MTFDQASKAIRRGDLSLLRNELENGLSPDLSNKFSWTILMIAAMTGNTRIGLQIIEKGADVDKENKFGETALELAITKGHPSFVRILARAGANLDLNGRPVEIHLNWAEKYCGVSKEQAENIRNVLKAERKLRESTLC